MKQLTWELANQLIAENTEEISSEEINKNALVSVATNNDRRQETVSSRSPLCFAARLLNFPKNDRKLPCEIRSHPLYS
jgi:hypothetical protein